MLKDESILITGGTGSFGRCMTEKLLKENLINRIVIYSRDEFKQDLMRKELEATYGTKMCDKVRFFIGDVRDKERLSRAVTGVSYVIHAAALKQVPACEYNPFEAIKTNIHGAQNVIDACLDRGVKKVIALSTDKAVNPINLYGGTKLVSDKLFSAANAYSGSYGCQFSVVRYGNVAGSRGSVIPFFHDLLKHGEKELPITDTRMTRFWMTLDDAVKMVLLAFKKSAGGETFVNKNPSFRITDLSEAMNPGGSFCETGIREGEKLHECMITSDDARMTYEFDKYYVIYPNYEWVDNGRFSFEGGKPVPSEWAYSSDCNTSWLSVEQLRAAINGLI